MATHTGARSALRCARTMRSVALMRVSCPSSMPPASKASSTGRNSSGRVSWTGLCITCARRSPSRWLSSGRIRRWSFISNMSPLSTATSALSTARSASTCVMRILSSATSASTCSKRIGTPRNSLVSKARNNRVWASGSACNSAMMRATKDSESREEGVVVMAYPAHG